jgi:hypothetical protein
MFKHRNKVNEKIEKVKIDKVQPTKRSVVNHHVQSGLSQNAAGIAALNSICMIDADGGTCMVDHDSYVTAAIRRPIIIMMAY